MVMWKYPPPEYVADGEAFEIAKIRALKKFFPKEAKLRLTYDPEELPDFEIEYQVKPRARWWRIGRQSEMTFARLPQGSAAAFLKWINDYYEEEVDVEGSRVDALYFGEDEDDN